MSPHAGRVPLAEYRNKTMSARTLTAVCNTALTERSVRSSNDDATSSSTNVKNPCSSIVTANRRPAPMGTNTANARARNVLFSVGWYGTSQMNSTMSRHAVNNTDAANTTAPTLNSAKFEPPVDVHNDAIADSSCSDASAPRTSDISAANSPAAASRPTNAAATATDSSSDGTNANRA